MKIKQLFTLALAAGISATSVAATEYGEFITNTGSLTYGVASDPTAAITAVSDPVVFTVDRKVIFTLDAPDSISPADNISNQQHVTYTLLNSSNAKIRFVLSALDLDSGETAYLNAAEVTDDTNTNTAPIVSTDYTIWNEVSGAGFNSGTDENITSKFVELDAGATTTIYVVTTPTKGLDQSIFVHSLTATAKEPANSKISGNTGGETILVSTDADLWVKDTIQTVVNGVVGEGLNREDRAAIQINSANLTMEKTFTVISDPYNSTNPKAIPGAVVEYTLTVINAGLVEATNVVIADTLPTEGFSLNDSFEELFTKKVGAAAATPLQNKTDANVDVTNNVVTFPPLTVPAKVLNGADGETVVTIRATIL